MKQINVYERVVDSLPEGKKFPVSVDRDLRNVSEALLRADTINDIEDIMENNRLLRNRIKTHAGVSAAELFDKCVEELKK
ncbi:MAG: hypothetical protein CR972_01330 [Candidatus Moraniibacteriota bacterium]|nr:MAG: hypothetical protein CR972_01330 [Candidatus Moranbacteria bacterium]